MQREVFFFKNCFRKTFRTEMDPAGPKSGQKSLFLSFYCLEIRTCGRLVDLVDLLGALISTAPGRTEGTGRDGSQVKSAYW